MPQSIFVWTFHDVFGLVVIGIIAIVFIVLFIAMWIERLIKKITRRKKNKVAGFTSRNSAR